MPYIKKKKRPDQLETIKLLRTMSIKDVAKHFNYSERAFRRWMSQNGIRSPRKQGDRLSKLANQAPLWK